MPFYPIPQTPGPWHFACGVFRFPRAQPGGLMPEHMDYLRGLEAARADAKQGWARCWMPAAQLAEQAVYSCFGLSAEQLGYAAGLDEAFPGGVPEISAFLDCVHSPGVLGLNFKAEAGATVDMLATVVREGAAYGPGAVPGGQWGEAKWAGGLRAKPSQDAEKQPDMARFVYVYNYTNIP